MFGGYQVGRLVVSGCWRWASKDFVWANQLLLRGREVSRISACLISDLDFGSQLAKAGAFFLGGVGVIKTSFGENPFKYN